jgi:hypothetical protein
MFIILIFGSVVLLSLAVVLVFLSSRPCYKEHVTILDVKYGDMHIAADFTIRELAVMCNVFLTLHEQRLFMSFLRNRKLDRNLDEVMNKLMEKLATVKSLDRVLQNEDTLSDGD